MLVGRRRKCKECKKLYQVIRDWQLFCSVKCRQAFNRRFRNICFYCGERGNHKHHVNPSAYSGKYYFQNVEYVYCCQECNNALSDLYFSTIMDSIDHIVSCYIARYELDKPKVQWDEDEIENLGFGLRGRIRKMLAIRHKAEERVVYLNAMKVFLCGDEELLD